MMHEKIKSYFRLRRYQGQPLKSIRGSREMLARFFFECGFTRGVEVGTWKGDYARMLCENNKGLKLVCVDPWKAYKHHSQEEQDRLYHTAEEKVREFGVTIIREKSLDAVDKFDDGSLDFAYIDGDHSFDACVQDIIRWTPKVKKGGIIAVHDYDSSMRGVIMAVDGYLYCNQIENSYLLCESRRRPSTIFWVKR